MALSSAPAVSIEPVVCPQAVIEWYKLTGSTDYKRGCRKRDLSLKAKQHLCALGWNLWYIAKQGRWELRYTSPNGRNHISLRSACERCIEEGGCGPENVPLIQKTKGLQVKRDHDHDPSTTAISSSAQPQVQPRKCKKRRARAQSFDDDELDQASSTAVIPSSAQSHEVSRKCKKPRAEPRKCKKRQRESFDDGDDDEWNPMGQSQSTSELDQASSTAVISSSAQSQEVPRKCKKPRADPRKCKKLRSEPRKCKKPRVRHGDEAQSSSNPGTVNSLLIDTNVVLSESKVLGPTNFEAHAGCTKQLPSTSIFLEDGRSLLDCQREALSTSQQKNHDVVMQRDSVYKDNNDSVCSICRYGGELILCDRCPSSFHLTCLGLEQVPDGDWFCPPCCCKICNRAKYREDCADNVDCSILVCDQCEHKYHIGCLKTRGFSSNLENSPNKNWFCNSDCENIFCSLQKLIGKAIPVGGADNLTWMMLKTLKSDNLGDLTSEDLERLSQIESKLSVALGVFRECFDPVIDPLTGRDIISDIMSSRGSELDGSNFRGFYTVILERNDQVISAATIRIYGQKVAELPFVATGRMFRRLGMCSILMNELEKHLTHLGIERMILPSSPSVIDTWTNSFGFARMTDLDKSQFLDYTFVDFQDTIMCHKLLMKPSIKRFDGYVATGSSSIPGFESSVAGSSSADDAQPLQQHQHARLQWEAENIQD
ncbi:increased DNA methylation 1-like [Gastrolobium bilobum]|uniref:increased DNA methylation 1-like n=1 Tax=Gastrolobium bilobum TaxID=150636 RepID=UPI002AB24B3F|nr:increased DNA methylation 1-like [Gastrolobium bilobum]